MTQCPDHPMTLGATLGQCIACDREAARVDHAAHVAAIRQTLAAAPRPARSHPEPEDHALELARARARADRADRKETRQ